MTDRSQQSKAVDNAVQTQPSFSGLVARSVTRFICIAALIYVGLFAADSIAWWQDSETARQHPCLNEVVEFQEILAPDAGHWTFAETDLSFERMIGDDRELQRQIEQLESLEPSPAFVDRDASGLIAIAKANSAKRSKVPSGAAWNFESSQCRLCLVTSDTDSPQLLGVAFGLRDDEGTWQLTVVKPQQARDDHLISFPNKQPGIGSNSICGRRSISGKLQMELVSVSVDAEALLNHWRSQGWSIKPTPWATANGFNYFCQRDDDIIYAWSQQLTGERTLMLVRTTVPNTPTTEVHQ